MNPARLHALFNARFQPDRRAAAVSPAATENQSLSAFFMGGG